MQMKSLVGRQLVWPSIVSAVAMFVTQRVNLDYDVRPSLNSFSSLLGITFARVVGSSKN